MTDTQNKLGSLIDQRYTLRVERLAADKIVKEMKTQEKDLDVQILEELANLNMTGARGHLATVSANPTTVSDVTDWDVFYAFIRESDYFHLLQRRVSEPAFRELLEKNGEVPGVVPNVITKLSITKAKVTK